MAQYKVTTASLTNGSANVTIAGDVTAEIDAGDIMIRVGEGIPYFVAAAPTYTPPDTTVVLTGSYAGTSGNGTVTFERDFLALDGEGLPLLSNGDLETPTIFTRAMSVVQSVIEGLIAGTRGFTNILITSGSANFATLTQDSINVVEAGMVGKLTTSTLLDLNLASAQSAQRSLGETELRYLWDAPSGAEYTHIDRFGWMQRSTSYTGTPSAAGSNSVTDTTQSWSMDALAGSDPYVVYLTDGTNEAYRWVSSNSATQIFWSRPISFTANAYKLSRPRFEANGLLVEAASTNRVTNNVTPLKSQLTAITGTATAPDGTTAKAYVPNTVNAIHSVGSMNDYVDISALAVGATQDVAISAYISAYGPLNYKPYLIINASDGTHHTYALVLFDAATGTFLNKGLGAGFTEITPPSATPMACGMYRVTWSVRWTQPSPARTKIGHHYQIFNELNQQTHSGDGLSGVHLFGHQIEALPFATSTIFTSGTVQTRPATRCALQRTNAQTADHTWIVDFDLLGDLSGTVAQCVVAEEGLSYHMIRAQWATNGIGFWNNDPGVPGTSIPTTTVSPINNMTRIGMVRSSDTYERYYNGVQYGTNGTAGTATGTATGLITLGTETWAGANGMSGHLRSLRIYDEALTASQMRVA